MDVAGVLDRYHNSFDIEKFRKLRMDYMTEAYARRKTDESTRQIYEYVKMNGISFPLKYRIAGEFRMVQRKIHKRFQKK